MHSILTKNQINYTAMRITDLVRRCCVVQCYKPLYLHTQSNECSLLGIQKANFGCLLIAWFGLTDNTSLLVGRYVKDLRARWSMMVSLSHKPASRSWLLYATNLIVGMGVNDSILSISLVLMVSIDCSTLTSRRTWGCAASMWCHSSLK